MQVSRRIAALEDALGIRLFHRTTRSISLTAEGEAFLPYAHVMIEAEESARGELSPSPVTASGLLRMTAPSVFGQAIVLPLLSPLLEAHPELRVDLDLSEQPNTGAVDDDIMDVRFETCMPIVSASMHFRRVLRREAFFERHVPFRHVFLDVERVHVKAVG